MRTSVKNLFRKDNWVFVSSSGGGIFNTPDSGVLYLVQLWFLWIYIVCLTFYVFSAMNFDRVLCLSKVFIHA